MQVANTFNNSIRILFNPRVEDFRLFDFLIVKSDDNRYVAQIVEIYDDKFDASQNVAKIKLFYRITQNNEVMPYDNFTPNKECEISKVKQEEIETFINQDKETFILGTNVKNSCGFNIQYDFFNKNAVILADKIENANSVTFNLAKKLSQKKNVIIIDTTGVLEYEGAKKILAGKNFKMPLDYSTIDHVFNRCLYDASLEFQAIGGEIINEIKKFAKKQEQGFIPFNLLTRVLIQQHKATPYPELKLLLVRLKKYQMDEIFARTKNEKEALAKTIEKNPITIIDLSSLDFYWQKTYLDYIVSDIDKEIYLITRINDESFDAELVNKIYNKKKNIKFVPNVSYNYKKLPSVMQHCRNYILMPSLVQRADFLDANFALSNLISDGCIVFGENTDNFLYLIRDYELEIQEKRKNYRKIALTMVEQDTQQNLGEKGDYFKNKENVSDSERLIQELSDFEAQRQENLKEQEETQEDNKETFEEIEDPNINHEKIEETTQEDLIFNEEEKEEIAPQVEIKNEAQDNFQEITSQTEEDNSFEDILEETNKVETIEEINEEETSLSEDLQEINLEEDTNTQELQPSEFQDIEIEKTTEEETQTQENTQDSSDELPILDDESDFEQEHDMDLSDDELDFFQMAQDSENENEEELSQDSDDIDLNAIADDSLDESFEEIINTKNQQNAQTIEVDEKTTINAEILNADTKKENLPIFKDEDNEPQSNVAYNIGNVIMHKKYGRGTIVKTIKYEERQLLQVEFEQAGKKLLDPKVADIKIEQ